MQSQQLNRLTTSHGWTS